jgi:Protein of unknown function (DUF3485)
MISARYAPAVSLLLGVALLPTVLSTYLDRRVVDDRTADAISQSLAGLNANRTARSPVWVQEMFATDDWIERRYSGSHFEEVLLFVARSYDPKRLYHHPERKLFTGVPFDNIGTIRLPERQQVPMHVLMSHREGRLALVAYSLLYGDDVVANPYLAQLRVAWSSLFTGPQPMTLFLVYDPQFRRDQPLDRAIALEVLVQAIETFRSQSAGTR